MTPAVVTPAVVTQRHAKDLTVNKVIAGAGAAATSAVLGSFFGAVGTVAGAALGSVASTVATAIYQRYLDRTRDTLVARIRPVAGRAPAGAPTGTSPSELTLPMQRAPEGETVRMRVEPAVPAAPSRRRWAVWVGVTVLVFAIGLLAVTGIEWLKGSTLTANDSGTSVGRVLGADHGTPTEPTPDPAGPAGASDGSTSGPTPSPTADPTSTADPGTGSAGSQGGGSQGGGPRVSGSPSTGSNGSGSSGTTSAPGLSGLLGGASGSPG